MNIELTGNFFKGASHWRSRTLTTLWVTQRWASSGYVRTIDVPYVCFKRWQEINVNRLPWVTWHAKLQGEPRFLLLRSQFPWAPYAAPQAWLKLTLDGGQFLSQLWSVVNAVHDHHAIQVGVVFYCSAFCYGSTLQRQCRRVGSTHSIFYRFRATLTRPHDNRDPRSS